MTKHEIKRISKASVAKLIKTENSLAANCVSITDILRSAYIEVFNKEVGGSDLHKRLADISDYLNREYPIIESTNEENKEIIPDDILFCGMPELLLLNFTKQLLIIKLTKVFYGNAIVVIKLINSLVELIDAYYELDDSYWYLSNCNLSSTVAFTDYLARLTNIGIPYDITQGNISVDFISYLRVKGKLPLALLLKLRQLTNDDPNIKTTSYSVYVSNICSDMIDILRCPRLVVANLLSPDDKLISNYLEITNNVSLVNLLSLVHFGRKQNNIYLLPHDSKYDEISHDLSAYRINYNATSVNELYGKCISKNTRIKQDRKNRDKKLVSLPSTKLLDTSLSSNLGIKKTKSKISWGTDKDVPNTNYYELPSLKNEKLLTIASKYPQFSGGRLAVEPIEKIDNLYPSWLNQHCNQVGVKAKQVLFSVLVLKLDYSYERVGIIYRSIPKNQLYFHLLRSVSITRESKTVDVPIKDLNGETITIDKEYYQISTSNTGKVEKLVTSKLNPDKNTYQNVAIPKYDKVIKQVSLSKQVTRVVTTKVDKIVTPSCVGLLAMLTEYGLRDSMPITLTKHTLKDSTILWNSVLKWLGYECKPLHKHSLVWDISKNIPLTLEKIK